MKIERIPEQRFRSAADEYTGEQKRGEREAMVGRKIGNKAVTHSNGARDDLLMPEDIAEISDEAREMMEPLRYKK